MTSHGKIHTTCSIPSFRKVFIPKLTIQRDFIWTVPAGYWMHPFVSKYFPIILQLLQSWFFKLQPYFMFLNHQIMNKVITSYSLILVATCSPTHPSKQKVHLHSPLLLYLLGIPPQSFSQLSVETDMFTRHLQYCKCLHVLYVLSISHSAFGNTVLFCFGACECFVCITVGTPCGCKSRGIRSPRTGVTRWVISLLQGQPCS